MYKQFSLSVFQDYIFIETNWEVQMGTLGTFLLSIIQKYEIKFSGLVLFLYITANAYWDAECTYVDVSWAQWTQLQYLFDIVDSNTNLFESFEAFFLIFAFICFLTSLSDILNLVPYNKSLLSWYTVSTTIWCIHRLSLWIVCEDTFHEDE